MRYAVRERMFSIGEDFWITDEQGNRVILADGKVMRLRQTVELEDSSGAVVAVVRKKLDQASCQRVPVIRSYTST